MKIISLDLEAPSKEEQEPLACGKYSQLSGLVGGYSGFVSQYVSNPWIYKPVWSCKDSNFLALVLLRSHWHNSDNRKFVCYFSICF